ncbi:MAG: aminotransferase class III-fold pyridoxal phosphate-dependent enzyme, partial [bacterium]|nr:aminotransferase class III-fold pyridoxal phosphate-dependent enzyme [Candidatus Kapabacteria bacterium]
KELRRICDEHEIMLIFDEVQTGVGLTGSMWAHEALGVTPDIISFGKKTQVCGILVSERVDEIENNVFRTSSRINSTWGGNLVDMVRFTKYLEIIEEEGLVENARVMGDYLQERLAAMQSDYPELISNSRGLGLMCAFDLPTHDLRDLLRKECYSRGMIVLSSGDRSIRFRPALNVTRTHVDEAESIMRASLAEMRGGVIPASTEAEILPTSE